MAWRCRRRSLPRPHPLLFPDDFIQQVRDRTDLLALIGAHVQLKRSGRSFKGRCPFHDEKTPSFHVHPDQGFYKCFGCDAGGDAITFVRTLQGYSFTEAITELAERAGLPLPERVAGRQHDGRASRKTLRDTMAAAQAWYREQGQRAPAIFDGFLRDRGLSAAVAEAFGLGLAPDGWEGLARHLRRLGIAAEQAIEAGLISVRERGGGHYDRFRHRVMFPIHDLGGHVVAFSGRTLSSEDGVPKYVNSPETSLYRKSALLFGLPQARKTLRDGGEAVLVEGNVDVVRLHGEGITEAVAPLGTALTEEQATLLKRFTERVIVVYDGDAAGEKATARALPILFAAGFDVRVARPPAGTDPDDLLDQGLDVLRGLLQAGVAGLQHAVADLRRRHGEGEAGRGRALREALKLAALFPDEPTQHAAAWQVHRLCGLEGRVSDRDVRRRLARARGRGGEGEGGDEDRQSAIVGGSSGAPAAEKEMAALALHRTHFAQRFEDDGGLGLILTPTIRTIIALAAQTDLDPTPPPSALIAPTGAPSDALPAASDHAPRNDHASTGPPPHTEAGADLDRLRAELLFAVPLPDDDDALEPFYLERLLALERRAIDDRFAALQSEFAHAERTGDQRALSRLREEQFSLTRRRAELRAGGAGPTPE